MKAVVRQEYGPPDVLELLDIDKPEPAADEVLVRVHAAGVNMADIDYMLGRPAIARLGTGLRQPRNRVLGLDLAGTVEATGGDVKRFAVGDEVFGDLTGFGFGAFAEYVCAREAGFAPKPSNLTFEQAATVPQAGVMALQGLNSKGGVKPGDRVVINGAGGNIGPFAVQVAKSYGAEVTGVDSAAKLDMLRSIGADQVIDYLSEDFTQGEQRYDRILDIAPYHTLSDYRRVLRPKGVYIGVPATLGGLFSAMLLAPLLSIGSGRRMGMHMGRPFDLEDVATLTELIEAGKVSPVIDRRYRLSEVPDALRYQATGEPRGKLVVNI